MFNGLADSIWAGTKKPDAAIKWVEYLGSAACQDVVASKAVVFPALKTSSDKAAEAFKAKGVDVSAFTQPREGRHHVPVPHRGQGTEGRGHHEARHGRGGVRQEAPASSLTEANEQVNALFK